MNLKKSFKLSWTLSIDFVEFSLKFKQIIILIFHSSFCFFFISKIISFGFQMPAVQLCYCVGFRISLSLSREGAIFQDKIDNYFSCFHLARRDRDYHKTILVFWEENEITNCYSRVSRRDRDFEIEIENHFSWSSEKKWSLLSSRILVELCLVLRSFERVRAGCMIALVESVSRNSQPHKPSQFSVVTIFFT